MQENPKEYKNAGKWIVALVPFAMILTYFGLQSGGVLFQKRLLIDMTVVSVIGIGGFMVLIAFLAKAEGNPRLRKMVFGFYLGVLVLMGLVVFKLNGLF